MGSGASVLPSDTSREIRFVPVSPKAIRIVPVSPKYASKDRKYRFDLADESTLTDCFTARASWYRFRSQKVIPIGGESLSVFLSSAKIFRPFY
jgi:hypothetical protein